MKHCNGCGGIIGRDCFNPHECEIISMQQAQQEPNYSQPENTDELIHYLQQHIQSLEERIQQLESATFNATAI